MPDGRIRSDWDTSQACAPKSAPFPTMRRATLAAYSIGRVPISLTRPVRFDIFRTVVFRGGELTEE